MGSYGLETSLHGTGTDQFEHFYRVGHTLDGHES
jgi:hypothetical protein